MNSCKIHQLQASYSQIQDRLLLRINTSDNMEFRFWLTRRFIGRLWPALRQTLENQAQITSTDANLRSALLEFMHHQATSTADFQAPFQETSATITPLGQEPILAVQARIEPVPGNDSLRRLSLHPEQGYGIDLAMDIQLMHAFCKLLADAIATADWNLDLGFAQPYPMQEMTMNQERILH